MRRRGVQEAREAQRQGGHGLGFVRIDGVAEGLLVTDLTTDSTEFISMRGREALYIHRDHPVQVLQLSGLGNEAGGTQLPTLYNSGSRRVVYARPNDARWTRMHILTPTANTSAIRIDGQLLDTALFTPVPEAEEWSYATVDMSRHAKDKTITVTSDGDIFHLSIIDASSAVRSKQGYAVPTSCSFGYFSSYSREKKNLSRHHSQKSFSRPHRPSWWRIQCPKNLSRKDIILRCIC